MYTDSCSLCLRVAAPALQSHNPPLIPALHRLSRHVVPGVYQPLQIEQDYQSLEFISPRETFVLLLGTCFCALVCFLVTASPSKPMDTCRTNSVSHTRGLYEKLHWWLVGTFYINEGHAVLESF